MRMGLTDCPCGGWEIVLVVALRLRDSVDEAPDERHQRGQEPQAPPHRTRYALHHLVPAEAAVAIERARDSPAAPALVQLQAAVGAARLLREVEQHGRLIAARAQARGD